MPRYPTTAEDQARRLHAYELYCTSDAQGKRPTFRAIAHQLGVTVQAVQYWCRRDRWQERIAEKNSATSRAIEKRQQDVKVTLRTGILEGVISLRMIAMGGAEVASDDIIKATLALVKIAKDLNALDLIDTPNPKPSGDIGFDDTLKEPCGTGSLMSPEESPIGGAEEEPTSAPTLEADSTTVVESLMSQDQLDSTQ